MALTALTGGARELLKNLVTDPNLVTLHILNETTLATLKDFGLNQLGLTLVNAPTKGVDIGNGFRGVTFSAASSQYGTFGAQNSLGTGLLSARTDRLSAIAICNVNNTAAIKTLVSYCASNLTNGWSLSIDSVESILVRLGNSAGDLMDMQSNAAVALATELLVGFSYSGSGSASGITLYKNGVAVAATALNDAWSSGLATYSGAVACIGACNAADRFYDGSIGLVAVFSATKTAIDHLRWADLAQLR